MTTVMTTATSRDGISVSREVKVDGEPGGDLLAAERAAVSAEFRRRLGEWCDGITQTIHRDDDKPPCEQKCGRAATVYAIDPVPGGWGGRYCTTCADALRFTAVDRLAAG